MTMKNWFASAAMATCLAAGAGTASLALEPIDAEDRALAVRALAQVIEDEFFDEARARQIASDLVAALEAGAFSEIDDSDELAGALTSRLSEEDRHFGVNYRGPDAVRAAMAAREASRDGQPDRDEDPYAPLRRRNFGFAEVSILSGNIGYVDLRMFAPIEPAEGTARAALEFIANTDAVIFDVRQNGGGAPSMVQYLISHFLGNDEPTLINTFVSRDYEYPNQMWSLPSHPAGNRPDVPLYVLTSGRTGSAAEGFSYHLRAMERATLIGETTYGAGNPGGTFLTDEGYSIFVSTGSARNPITMTNWEGVGVEPHQAVAAPDAMDHALMSAYDALAASEEDPLVRRSLEWAAEGLRVAADPIVLSEEALQRYAGDFGIRDTWVEDGALQYRREGGPQMTLVALGDDRFAFPDDDSYRLIFRFNRGNEVMAMDMQLADGRELSNPVAD
jgi:hypothetical protein